VQAKRKRPTLDEYKLTKSALKSPEKPFGSVRCRRSDGIEALKENMEKRLKWHGRGHEAQDALAVSSLAGWRRTRSAKLCAWRRAGKMMKVYKEWAFDLAPFLGFEDFINRCDKLRSKRIVHLAIQEQRTYEEER
jgi:hypothetical protein